MGKVFKTAIFGGFKKREVVSYLDNLSREKKQDKEINDERIVKLEQANFEMKNKLADAERECALLTAQLITLQQENEQLRDGMTELERQKSAVSGELSRAQAMLRELEQHNSALSSRVLDFDDERRAAQADIDEQRREFEECRRELESRIFDLEAEIVEGLERHPSSGSAERAYRGAREVSRSIEGVVHENGRRVLEDLKTQLEDIIQEINRLISAPEQERAPAQASSEKQVYGKREKRPETRLSSLGDILRHVKSGKRE